MNDVTAEPCPTCLNTGKAPVVELPVRDATVQALLDHPEQVWGDDSSGCGGCAQRIEDQWRASDDDSPQAREAARAESRRFRSGWTRQQWREHVGDMVVETTPERDVREHVQVMPDLKNVAELICESDSSHRDRWQSPDRFCVECRERARVLAVAGLLATTPVVVTRGDIADAVRSNILGASGFAQSVRYEVADSVLALLNGSQT